MRGIPSFLTGCNSRHRLVGLGQLLSKCCALTVQRGCECPNKSRLFGGTLQAIYHWTMRSVACRATLMCSFICCLLKPLKPSLISPIGLPRSRTAILIGNASPMRPTSKPLATKLRRRNSRRSSRTSMACAWRLRRARSFAGHTTARKGVSLPRQESPAGVVSMLACAVVRIIPCRIAKSDK